jgi:hypothetical protein
MTNSFQYPPPRGGWCLFYQVIHDTQVGPFFKLISESVFIITDKSKLVGEEVTGVGVMKDEELKLEEIEDSLTLGG